MRRVELELISGADIYLFFEKDMGDEVSDISKRYSKANNKYLRSYDSKQESKYIINLGTDNWYYYAMFKFLSTCRFKWIDPKEFDSNKYGSNSSKGCVLEIDLEHPKKLRKLYNDIEIKKFV